MKVELFAVNLTTPSHMEWTKDGKLLISEHTAGNIKDITNGGDFKNVKPFVENLKGPSSILPLNDGRILVSEMWGNKVTDVTNRGNSKTFVEAKNPYSLSQVNGEIILTEKDGNRSIKVSKINENNEKSSLVEKIPFKFLPGLEGLTPKESWPDHWYEYSMSCGAWDTDPRPNNPSLRSFTEKKDLGIATCSALGTIFRIPEKNMSYAEVIEDESLLLFTGLDWCGGMYQNPLDNKLYVSQPRTGSVIALDFNKLGDYRFHPPVIRGLNFPTCIRFSSDGKDMYVCSMPIGSVWKITDYMY